MALSAKAKRIAARLEAIKEEASALAVNPKQADAAHAAGLAEEAAGLGLELAEDGK
jgi:hypothetical protein